MSNRPKIQGKKKTRNPNKITKIKTPARLRIINHIGDMAGCGTIRIMTPCMLLNSFYSPTYTFEAIYNNRYSPDRNFYNDTAYVVFQRSATKQQLDIIRHFKQQNPGRAVIYEIDDLLMGIPEWNFASQFYKEHEPIVQKIIGECHGVITSTKELKKALLPYNSNINVSPNHLPKFIWGEANAAPVNTGKPRIMYAGSHNHFDQKSDRGDFSPALIEFVKSTLDKYQWIFIGGMPLSLKGNEKIISHAWKSTLEYPSFMRSMEPDIFLAPLDDNHFNSCKSNIKALESVALGVPLVASKLAPYDGIPFTVSDDDAFIQMVEDLADEPEMRTFTWKQQHEALKDQLFWEDNDHKNLLDHVNQHLRLTGREL